MALTRCPECRKKISENAENCPNCGFSFKQADLEIYKQQLERRRLQNSTYFGFASLLFLSRWLVGLQINRKNISYI